MKTRLIALLIACSGAVGCELSPISQYFFMPRICSTGLPGVSGSLVTPFGLWVSQSIAA